MKHQPDSGGFPFHDWKPWGLPMATVSPIQRQRCCVPNCMAPPWFYEYATGRWACTDHMKDPKAQLE
jgi:hypothetical protein